MNALANTTTNFRDAANALEKAVDDLRAEADWLERNYPLTEWSPETAESYLASSAASREHAVRIAAVEALKRFGVPAELIRSIARGGQR